MGLGGVMGDLGGISYDILVNDLTKQGTDSAIQNLERVEGQASKTTLSLKQITMAFAALTAASATAVMASDRVVSLERATAHAAVTQGVTTRAMYEYVQKLSSASDSQEEVGATMSYLSRTGLKMADDLTSVYKTMDLIGDSVGESSTAIAQQLIPAFQSLGLTSKDIAGYADLFAYAVNNSLMDVSTWSMFVRRYADSMITYKVQVSDTIAIMERMSELGIPQRKIMTMMGEAFKEMGAGAAMAAKAEEELLEIQERLNEAQRKGADINRDYIEDMSAAEGDVSSMRSLTLSYNRRMRSQYEDTADLRAEADAKRAEVDKTKSMPQQDIIASLAKAYPSLFDEASLREAVKTTTDKSKGAAGAYSPVGGISTGSEMASYDMDQLMQNTLGKNIDANTAKNMVYLRDISGAMTAVTGILTIIQGLSATTATMTTATAAGSLNPIIAGIGFGALGLIGMEAAGIGPTAAYDLGKKYARDSSGETDKAYVAEYLRTHNGQYPPGYDPVTSRKIPAPVGEEYAEGGLVPGDGPQGAIVHGGELIVPKDEVVRYRTIADTMGGHTGEYGDIIRAISDALAGAVGGLTISIQNVTLSRDYPLQSFVTDAQRLARDRKQMGIRTAQ